jgi:hypothetical protein
MVMAGLWFEEVGVVVDCMRATRWVNGPTGLWPDDLVFYLGVYLERGCRVSCLKEIYGGTGRREAVRRWWRWEDNWSGFEMFYYLGSGPKKSEEK